MPELDREQFDSLYGSVAQGDPAVRQQLFDDLAASLHSDFEELTAAAAREDWPSVAGLAHRLGGGAAMFGAARLGAHCRKLQADLKARSLADRWASDLERELGESLHALELAFAERQQGSDSLEISRRSLHAAAATGRVRTFISLRFGMIIAAAYMLMGQNGIPLNVNPRSSLLILVAIASNFALLAIRPERVEAQATGVAIVLFDTLWITAGLLGGSGFGSELFFLYFFVIFQAAMVENVRVIVFAGVLVCLGYLFAVSQMTGLPALLETATLIRLPFLLSVALFHGYMVERARASRAESEEEVKQALDQRAEQIVKTNRQLKAETERRVKTEQQLLQSQKMEAIGMLAGGIAHDFNNALTVVSGFSDLLEQELGDDGEASRYLAQIKKAGAHAGSLTRQLLAFSRQQLLTPVACDPNRIVGYTREVLAHTLGERVDLDLRLDPDIFPVRVDAVQLEQVLINLALNARDAMPAGGCLTIETRNVSLSAFADEDFEVDPGDYAMIVVADEGCGMSEETRRRAFEPFYTTKGVGEGSGLGLATVYGIVKQSRGYVWIDSLPGLGTRVRICLPRTLEEVVEHSREPRDQDTMAGGCETVLLVEDSPMVLDFASRVLSRQGYRVLTAATPDEAVRRLLDARGPVDLLVTDVGLPGRSGLDLADEIRGLSPETKTIFMSGYREYPGDQRFEDQVCLQKPFSPERLACTVRLTLDGNAAVAGPRRPVALAG